MAEFKIPALSPDGSNWSAWHMQVEQAAAELGLREYLTGTMTDPVRQLDTTTKWIIVSSLPDSILGIIFHLTTAHEQWEHLRNRFGEPTVLYKTAHTATEAAHERREVEKEPGRPEVNRCASERKRWRRHHTEASPNSVKSRRQKSVRATTNVSTRSASHSDHQPTLTDTGSATSTAATVDESKQTGIKMPIKYPTLPDSSGNKVQCTRVGEAEVEVSRGLDKVEVATDGDGDDEHRPQQPTEPPDDAEEGARRPDAVHDTLR